MRSEAASPSPDPKALGVLLAGGLGERLGLGVPKAHAVLGGRTLFERALAALGGACARVWVAAPEGMELPLVGEEAPRFARVDDIAGAGGPLAGIAAVAADPAFATAARETGARIVALAVDLPLVTASTVRSLLASFAVMDAGAPALIPAPGGRAQPLAAVWSPASFTALATAFASGERSVTRASAGLGARMLDDAALVRLQIAEEVARDVDTAADLADASRWLHDVTRESA